MDDLYFNNVSLLLHCNGSNGSTAFTDNSPAPKTVTANGGAIISTTQSQFGGSSAKFTADTDKLTITGGPYATDCTEFTYELWIYPTAIGGSRVKSYVRSGANGGCIREDSNNLLMAFLITKTGTFCPIYALVPPTLNTWQHLAIVLKSNVMTLYKNGSAIGSVSVPGAVDITNSSAGISVGSTGSEWFPGYVDELRITPNIARYTANFTPPDAPFPDTQLIVLTKLIPAFSKALRPDLNPIWGGPKTVSGTVKIGSLLVKRRVRLYEANTGVLIREQWADDSGNYSFPGLRADLKYTVTAVDYANAYNDVLAANVMAL